MFLACLRCTGGCFSPFKRHSEPFAAPASHAICNRKRRRVIVRFQSRRAGCLLCRPHPSSSMNLVFFVSGRFSHSGFARSHQLTRSHNSRRCVHAGDVILHPQQYRLCWAESTQTRPRQSQGPVVDQAAEEGGILSVVPRGSAVSAVSGSQRPGGGGEAWCTNGHWERRRRNSGKQTQHPVVGITNA